MNWPIIEDALRHQRLAPPAAGQKLRMILDTDTYNEVDDQFALAQAVLAPERLKIEAIHAAPFHNGRSAGPADGMEKSYEEILRLLQMLNVKPDGFVFRGSTGYLPGKDQPVESDAAQHLVECAMRKDDRPLYVVAIGAITNVASALLMEPEILRNIVIVWLGGSDTDRESAHEFNLSQDIPAAQIVFDSGVPLVHVPCRNVTSHLITTKAELAEYLKGKGKLADYLFEIVDAYGGGYAWSKVIWDIAATSWLINPDWLPSRVHPSPLLTDRATWAKDPTRHPVREVRSLNRDAVFADVFRRITSFGGE